MKHSGNRVRQARRAAGLSQQELAVRVGVHRSAVAQWEKPSGSNPTMENASRIALSTAVSFEWLVTGRGRMKYRSDIVPSDEGNDEPLGVLIDHSAQSDTEVRALVAMRKLDYSALFPIIELMEALARPAKLKLSRVTPYSR